MRTLYVVRKGERCLTHDGHIQLGSHSHSVERHLELNSSEDITFEEVHWTPDIFAIRYPRVNYQRHMATNEGSPKTDNAGDNRPRDFPGSEP